MHTLTPLLNDAPGANGAADHFHSQAIISKVIFTVFLIYFLNYKENVGNSPSFTLQYTPRLQKHYHILSFMLIASENLLH